MEEVPMSYTDPAATEDAVEFPRSALMTPENMMLPYDYQSFISSELFHHICLASSGNQFVSSSSSSMLLDSEVNSSDVVVLTDGTSDDHYQVETDHSIQERDEMGMLMIKGKIMDHPLFPRMLRAYAECQKFAGDEQREAGLSEDWELWNDDISSVQGSDPELDQFMQTYCGILEKHNEDLRNTFSGVTSFLNGMEMQLADICGALSTTSLSGKDAKEAVIPSPEDQEQPVTGTENDQASAITDLKMKLLSKYGCEHLRDLRIEFSKRTKKKKGKLPGQARQVLVNWWRSHHSWPYPTEADKVELTRMTGLLPKQINNWFINRRKRHWKTSAESLLYSWVDNNLSAGRDLHFPDEEFDAA